MVEIEWSDEVLVRNVLQGDHPAFTHIVEKYRDRLYAICYGYLLDHEEAMDLVQDVFVQAYEKLDSLRQWDKLGPFLARIAQNYSRNRIKSRKRFRAAKERMGYRATVEEQSAVHQLSDAERNDLHAVLRVLVKTLPASSREVVLLHYFEEMSTPEISEFLGVRQPAVLQRLHYGRNLLRTRMEHELKPALENDEQRNTHIQAILAAIPFGRAPWAGSAVPLKPQPTAQVRRMAALKAGAAGSGFIAAAGLLAWWFVLATLNQPNPPVQSIASSSANAAHDTANVAPDSSDHVALSSVPAAPNAAKTRPAKTGSTAPASASVATEPVELVFGPPPWAPDESTRAALQSLIDVYASIEPDVRIVLAPDRAPLDFHTVTADQVGDVILDESLYTSGSAILARLRELDALVPLDEFIAEDAFEFNDFYPNVQELVFADEQVWGIPFFAVSWAFALPPTLEEEPWIARHLRTWDNFSDVLTALWVDPTGDGRRRTSAALLDPEVLWNCLFLDAGGDLNNPTTLQVDSVAATRASDNFWKWFSLNQPAFQPVGGRYEQGEQGPGGRFVLVKDLDQRGLSVSKVRAKEPSATIFGAPGTGAIASVLTHALAITRSTPDRERAAWRFVQWLTSKDMLERLYHQSGILPLRASLRRIVVDPDHRVLLRQIRRMQFQKPDLSCIQAYRQLADSFLKDLQRQYRLYEGNEVAAAVQDTDQP